MVEQRIENSCVTGSSPVRGTNKKPAEAGLKINQSLLKIKQ